VRADRGQVEQIVMNLAVNARDAMATSGTVTVWTTNASVARNSTQAKDGIAPGHYAVLALRDNGCGMDPATMAQIWEPFFSTKGHKGTGLGLSTVYGIVKQ